MWIIKKLKHVMPFTINKLSVAQNKKKTIKNHTHKACMQLISCWQLNISIILIHICKRKETERDRIFQKNFKNESIDNK